MDEFHHAAADSYQELLAYYEPKILLGLTATPDRMDGKDILKYFDGRIASKLLLGEAIDRNLLSSFPALTQQYRIRFFRQFQAHGEP